MKCRNEVFSIPAMFKKVGCLPSASPPRSMLAKTKSRAYEATVSGASRE